jgi:hypothetical protein
MMANSPNPKKIKKATKISIAFILAILIVPPSLLFLDRKLQEIKSYCVSRNLALLDLPFLDNKLFDAIIDEIRGSLISIYKCSSTEDKLYPDAAADVSKNYTPAKEGEPLSKYRLRYAAYISSPIGDCRSANNQAKCVVARFDVFPESKNELPHVKSKYVLLLKIFNDNFRVLHEDDTKYTPDIRSGK